MAEGFGFAGVQPTPGSVPSAPPAGPSLAEAAQANALVHEQAAPEATRQPGVGTQGTTTFTREPAVPTESRVVQRLLEQNATVYSPGLARIPLPARPEGVPRAVPKKPAGPMTAPRDLDGGRSPLATGALSDARAAIDTLSAVPTSTGEQQVVADATDGAYMMPSRHGLVAYTTTGRGDSVYLTQERWLHIRDNHMDPEPTPRGKRTTTYWPTAHAVENPTMTDQDVIGVIVDTARKGVLRTEVRDTRMAEYDLPAAQAEQFGVSEAKVSMAPDGLVLSAYPGAGDNVLAVYEMSPDDQAALQRATAAQAQAAPNPLDDQRMFRTNVATTSFG